MKWSRGSGSPLGHAGREINAKKKMPMFKVWKLDSYSVFYFLQRLTLAALAILCLWEGFMSLEFKHVTSVFVMY